jgi:hypothetical protein
LLERVCCVRGGVPEAFPPVIFFLDAAVSTSFRYVWL